MIGMYMYGANIKLNFYVREKDMHACKLQLFEVFF